MALGEDPDQTNIIDMCFFLPFWLIKMISKQYTKQSKSKQYSTDKKCSKLTSDLDTCLAHNTL